MFVKVKDKENNELIVVNTDQITLMAICTDGAFVLVPEKSFTVDKPSYDRIRKAMELENLIKHYTLQIAPIDFLADYKEVRESCETCKFNNGEIIGSLNTVCAEPTDICKEYSHWQPKEEVKKSCKTCIRDCKTRDGEERYWECWQPKEEMRLIKFRAFDKATNRLAEVQAITFETDEIKIAFPQKICGHQVHPFTYYRKLDAVILEQYTGLNDKNGKEIYEGDKVEVFGEGYVDFGPIRCDGNSESDFWKLQGVVEYFGCEWVFKTSDGLRLSITYAIHEDCEFKVIGNIYENPELSKEEVKKSCETCKWLDDIGDCSNLRQHDACDDRNFQLWEPKEELK
jgi:uncharacterized phage protein (TIGR01671 family)